MVRHYLGPKSSATTTWKSLQIQSNVLIRQIEAGEKSEPKWCLKANMETLRYKTRRQQTHTKWFIMASFTNIQGDGGFFPKKSLERRADKKSQTFLTL